MQILLEGTAPTYLRVNVNINVKSLNISICKKVTTIDLISRLR